MTEFSTSLFSLPLAIILHNRVSFLFLNMIYLLPFLKSFINIFVGKNQKTLYNIPSWPKPFKTFMIWAFLPLQPHHTLIPTMPYLPVNHTTWPPSPLSHTLSLLVFFSFLFSFFFFLAWMSLYGEYVIYVCLFYLSRTSQKTFIFDPKGLDPVLIPGI